MRHKLSFIVLMLAGVLTGLLTGCTDATGATRVLAKQGYTDIQITGYRWFMCGQDDTFSTGFSAKTFSTDRVVTGAVCSGWLKGNTVRFDD